MSSVIHDRPSLTPVELVRREWLTLLVLFVGSLVLSVPYWFNGLGDGVITVGASRVAAGEMPYRDFWTMYAPGSFLLLGGVFKLFGTHLLTERILGSVISAAAVCVMYLLAGSILRGRKLALFVAVAFLGAFLLTGPFYTVRTYPPAILGVLLALWAFVTALDSGRARLLILGGLATGVAAVFKHDVAAYSWLAISLGLVLRAVTESGELSERLKTAGRRVMTYGVAAAAVVVPVVVWVIVIGGQDAIYDLVEFPAGDFRFSRGEDYPSLIPFWIYDTWKVQIGLNMATYVMFAMPIAGLGLGTICAVVAGWNGDTRLLAIGVTIATLQLLHFLAAHVQINTHIVSMTGYGALLLCVFLEWTGAGERIKWGSWALAVVGLGWLGAMALRPAVTWWDRSSEPKVSLQLPGVSGIRVAASEAQWLTELAALVDELTEPTDKLYVGPHRHDAVIIGATYTYMVLGRESATRYQEIHPGVVDTRPVQQEMIQEIERYQVPIIVGKHIFSDDVIERAKRNFLLNLPVGATDLDDYIRSHYALIREIGPYGVWERLARAGTGAP